MLKNTIFFFRKIFVPKVHFPQEEWIEKSKYNTLVTLLYILSILFPLLMIFRYIQGEIFLSQINLCAFLISFILIIILRHKTENFTLVSRLFIFLTSILVTIVIVSSDNDSRIIWLSSMTIYTFYFRDKKEGIYWSIFLAILIVVAQYSNIVEVSSTLKTLDMVAILVNFAIVSLLLSWYENIKIHDRKNLLSQIKEKEELNKKLHKENKQRKIIEEKLKILADTDYMTKLYNRRYFSNAAKHILEIAKRSKVSLSIIMIDIDKFKDINDTYNHGVGDDVIINLSNMLITHSRKSDIVCRWGGEEFIILLSETNIKGAIKVAEIIRKKVENSTITLSNKDKIHYTISAGVSQLQDENHDISDVIKNADIALYEAKDSGRNKVCSIHISTLNPQIYEP